ncbi:MAG TPA: amino acid ABC transporter substrate-binding protein [Devosiaceae bacterium]|nr:amino acid ABC transporter substrate-binding protein [Devosiaceae bacterium]
MPAKLVAAALLALLSLAGGARADTLAAVKARGAVICGASSETTGFSATQVGGNWVGLGADYCRGLAAVIFNDPSKVRFVPLQAGGGTSALVSGQVDALADLIPWTLGADTEHGLKFVGTMFYDGQGFLVTKASGLKSVRDLAGKEVCVEAGSPAQADAAEYFDANNIPAKVEPMGGREAAVGGYVAGTCAAYSAAYSVLAGVRATLSVPANHVILADLITKEPLSLVIRQGDDRWFDIARWTFYALLDAEELGVTQGNVDEMLGSDNISVRRLLGVEGDFGSEIGLNKDWAYQLIKGVGNYGDIYDRNIGEESPLKLPRGLNALWNHGGIQYSPPVR